MVTRAGWWGARFASGHGRPFTGAMADVYQAADDGNCSGLYDDGTPKCKPRGHQLTGADGRCAFTTSGVPGSARRTGRVPELPMRGEPRA